MLTPDLSPFCRNKLNLTVNSELLNKFAEIPIPNLKKTTEEQLQKLAEAFDKLEVASRKIGGANSLGSIKSLAPEFEYIDSTIAAIFGFPEDLLKRARELVTLLMERRIARTKLATAELLKSEEKALDMVPSSKREFLAKRQEMQT